MSKLNLEKYGFEKTKKNQWIGWHDYLLKDINSKYGYYLRATLHVPRDAYLNSDLLEHRMYKVMLHRYFLEGDIDRQVEEGEAIVVYVGLIESDEDLDFVLKKTGIIQM
jgi:hypothetical protein